MATVKNLRKGEPQTLIKITASQAPGFALFIVGLATLIAAFIYTSNIGALIGLGLTFWGIILLYIQTDENIPASVLEASIPPYAYTLDQIIQALDLKGNPVLLPPKYFENPQDTRIFIPKQKTSQLPTPEQTQKNNNRLLMKEPNGILIIPPGTELAKLFERTLETNFTTADLQFLQQRMPQLLIENLELITDFEIQTQNAPSATEKTPQPTLSEATEKIRIKLTTTTYKNTFEQTNQNPSITVLANPLTSAISIAIAKATGKPVTIENQKITNNENSTNVTIYYRTESEPTK